MFSAFSQKYGFPVESKTIMYSKGCIKKIKKEKKSYWHNKAVLLIQIMGFLNHNSKTEDKKKYFFETMKSCTYLNLKNESKNRK